ncbi:MAG: M48 family metalloprotease [Gammaproteobacteria bacterium]|nr:M48 family metalloprotease [Gammaproteobacteria bacterium]
MAILAVAASLALAALPVLLWVRSKSNGEEPGHRVNQMTWIAALVMGGGAALTSLEALSATVWTWIDRPSNAWLSSLCLGAMMGLTIYVSIWVALFRLAAAVHRWSFRLPPEQAASWRDKLPVEVCLLLATVGGIAFAVVLGHAATTIGLPVWAVVPLMVAILPLYQTFALPWLTYLRAPRLTSRNIADVEAWLEDLRLERRLPSFHVRIQEGRIANAFATAGLGAHLVVIGGRLLERMSHSQLCAVLAHEVAHVVKRHVPRLVLPLTIVGTWLHVLCVISFVHPLFDRQEPLLVVTGAALAGAFAGLFIVAIPGVFMRRMEFQADRLAVEMLGDGEPLVDALTKLAELNKQPLDARSWSHPTMQARIDAIRALEPNGAPS